MAPQAAGMEPLIKQILGLAQQLFIVDNFIGAIPEVLTNISDLRGSLLLCHFFYCQTASLHLGIAADAFLQNELSLFDDVNVSDWLSLAVHFFTELERHLLHLVYECLQ